VTGDSPTQRCPSVPGPSPCLELKKLRVSIADRRSTNFSGDSPIKSFPITSVVFSSMGRAAEGHPARASTALQLTSVTDVRSPVQVRAVTGRFPSSRSTSPRLFRAKTGLRNRGKGCNVNGVKALPRLERYRWAASCTRASATPSPARRSRRVKRRGRGVGLTAAGSTRAPQGWMESLSAAACVSGVTNLTRLKAYL